MSSFLSEHVGQEYTRLPNTLQLPEISILSITERENAVKPPYTLPHPLHTMILGSKGHAFHACMKKHDLLTRKTPKSSHFS